MQLMKQNGIQVNNNNSNSSERLSAQQFGPSGAAAQPRGVFFRGGGRGGGSGVCYIYYRRLLKDYICYTSHMCAHNIDILNISDVLRTVFYSEGATLSYTLCH